MTIHAVPATSIEADPTAPPALWLLPRTFSYIKSVHGLYNHHKKIPKIKTLKKIRSHYILVVLPQLDVT